MPTETCYQCHKKFDTSKDCGHRAEYNYLICTPCFKAQGHKVEDEFDEDFADFKEDFDHSEYHYQNFEEDFEEDDY